MKKRFAQINAEKNLCGLALESFATRDAEHINAINAIHPFIDGNGRTQRAFLHDLAAQAGYQLDLTQVSRSAWYDASRIGFINLDHTPLQQRLVHALSVL